MMMLHIAMASAASVPLRRRSCRTERVASQLTRGSMVTSLAPRFMRSMIAWPKKPSGLEASGILPQRIMSSGTVYSGSS